ncbi:O-methyltransferase aurJ, partial [Lachnellula suecica]
MCKSPPLESFAQEICSSAKIIDAYCLSAGLPYPTFDPGAPSITLPSNAPTNILEARQKLIASAFKIQQLATEPSEFVPRLAIHFQSFACIHWLCHFRILSFLPLEGSVPYSELATIASVPLTQLKRISRMAILSNFLQEPKPNELAHSNVSALLVTNPGLLDWALFMAEATATGAAKLVEATERWGTTEAKNQTAFNIARDTELPFFDYLAQTPELRKKFAMYMKNVTVSEGTKIDHLVNGFDWASLGEATVVDVGGSNCHASLSLATTFPQLRLIVQDLPDTIALAQNTLSSAPTSVRNRITCQAHNFFTVEPVVGANIYLLRMILHDWADEESISILQNLLPALVANPSSRLLIMDTVLPVPSDNEDPIDEAMLRVRDLTMMEAFNSRERELADWERLLDEAGKTEQEGLGVKFVLVGMKKPFGSMMSVLEVAVVSTNNGIGAAETQFVNGGGAKDMSNGEMGTGNGRNLD